MERPNRRLLTKTPDTGTQPNRNQTGSSNSGEVTGHSCYVLTFMVDADIGSSEWVLLTCDSSSRPGRSSLSWVTPSKAQRPRVSRRTRVESRPRKRRPRGGRASVRFVGTVPLFRRRTRGRGRSRGRDSNGRIRTTSGPSSSSTGGLSGRTSASRTASNSIEKPTVHE